jgi:WD40 repeat protein
VSGSADETLKLWERSSGRCRHTLEAEPLYAGMRIGGVRGLSAGAVATLKALGALEPDA